jgi:hypothetical protein
MRTSRFSEEQIMGILREHEAGARRRSYAGGTGSRTQPSTSMDGSPLSSRFGLCSDENRLQTSIRRRLFMVRPNGKSAYTLLE